jgi:cytochrome P450
MELLLGDAAFHPDPYAMYRALRERQRVSGLFLDEQLGARVACTAAAVAQALRDPDLRVRPRDEPVPRALQGTPTGTLFGGLMRMNDGPTHEHAKARVSPLLDRLQGRVLAAPSLPSPSELNDAIVEAPLLVLAAALDVPAADRPRLVASVRSAVAGWSPLAGDAQRSAAHGAASELLAMFEGDANRAGLFTQTCEATAGLVGNTLVALRREAGLVERWRAEPALRESICAEVARHDAPIQNTRRFADDGSCVMVLLASANRDEAAFAEPDRFDPQRGDAGFTFGADRHACPGRTLALRIVAAVVGAWLDQGFDPATRCARWTYARSPNARLPRFLMENEP